MDLALQIEHWPAELLKAAVLDESELPRQQAEALRDFVRRIGGHENALLAANILAELENAWEDDGLGF